MKDICIAWLIAFAVYCPFALVAAVADWFLVARPVPDSLWLAVVGSAVLAIHAPVFYKLGIYS